MRGEQKDVKDECALLSLSLSLSSGRERHNKIYPDAKEKGLTNTLRTLKERDTRVICKQQDFSEGNQELRFWQREAFHTIYTGRRQSYDSGEEKRIYICDIDSKER